MEMDWWIAQTKKSQCNKKESCTKRDLIIPREKIEQLQRYVSKEAKLSATSSMITYL